MPKDITAKYRKEGSIERYYKYLNSENYENIKESERRIRSLDKAANKLVRKANNELLVAHRSGNQFERLSCAIKARNCRRDIADKIYYITKELRVIETLVGVAKRIKEDRRTKANEVEEEEYNIRKGYKRLKRKSDITRNKK